MSPLNRNRLRLSVIALTMAAGCPAPSRYIVADVSAKRAPVEDALVAADCDPGTIHSARRTDERGRARVRVGAGRESDRCVVTVAKPGYRTIERRGASACSKSPACPQTSYRLEPMGSPATAAGAER